MEEEPRRLAPTIDTLRALFAKSGNKCAFSNCKHNLIDEDNTFIAQVCHIEAALKDGERFNPNMTNEERRGYNNLMLLCYPHHVKTNDTAVYTVERLREMKNNHEMTNHDVFNVDDIILQDIFTVSKNIKDDTTKIINTQEEQGILLRDIKALVLGTDTHLEQIESFAGLLSTKNHVSALKLLEKLKLDKWNDLSNIEKYKVEVNIGICQLETNDEKNAAKHFIDALQYNPSDDNALSISAMGYIIEGRTEEAQLNIEKVINRNSKNLNAYLALIILHKNDWSLNDLLERIPEEIRNNSQVLYSIGMFCQHKRDFHNAINYLTKALDTSVKNKQDMQASLGTTILESISEPFQILLNQISIDTKNKISYSIELLTEAWEGLKDTDLRKTRTWVLVNRGIAKKFLKDFSGAYDDIKIAASISENEPFVIRHYAIISFEIQRYDDVFPLLDKLDKLANDLERFGFDSDLFRAVTQLNRQDYPAAIEILQRIIESNKSIRIKKEAQSTLLRTYLRIGNINEARILCNAIINEGPENIEGYILSSLVDSNSGDKNQAIEKLNVAYLKINESSDTSDIYELAGQYYRLQDYKKTIDLLERITDKTLLTELSKTLLDAYYKDGEMLKALEICENMRKGYSPIDFITEIHSSIYESNGSLLKAIEICEEYLKTYPDDQIILIRLMAIYVRAGENEKARKNIKKIGLLGNLPINTLFLFSNLCLTIGEIDTGLVIAYNSRRKYNNESNAHSKYVYLFVAFNSMTSHLSEIKNVTSNTAVKLRTIAGEELTYIICNAGEKPEKDEILITDPIAEKLLNKKVGDIIEIKRELGNPEKLEVVSVLSKYVYAFQESLRLIQFKFINEQGIKPFTVGQTGNPSEDFKRIFEAHDNAEKFAIEINKLYKQRLLTIGAYAELQGINPIKSWFQVVSNPELELLSTGVINHEIQISHIYLDKNTGIVLDLISILSLFHIDELSLLEKIPSRKVIAQSTIDYINDFINEQSGMSSYGYTTLSKVQGRFTGAIFTKEDVQKLVENFKKLLSWLKSNCETLPCNEALNMNSAEKIKLDNAIGKAFIDSILIAKEHNFLFFADESFLRNIALNEHKIKGISSYSLLVYCLNKSIIENDEFNQSVTKLIGFGYAYLPVNEQILMKCVDKAQYKFANPFILALKTLNFQISSEESSIRVTTGFFYQLYASEIPDQIKLEFILPVLSELVYGRNIINVIKKLQNNIEIKFRLLQPQKDKLLFIVNDFMSSYFKAFN